MPSPNTDDPLLPSLGVEEALQGLLDSLSPLEAVRLSLDEAGGLILAESVVSSEDHPADDMSAMDGYALRISDLADASQENSVALKIIEDVKAGFPPQKEVLAGEASRISTGALIPAGADAVEMREFVEVTETDVACFSRTLPQGANIRRAGEHLKAQETIMEPGTRLGSAEIGMAAFLGLQDLLCHPRLTVAILSTGSELVETSAKVERGQIRDSNSVALAQAVKQLGCQVVRRQRVADDAASLRTAIQDCAAEAQVLLTSGGISAGWHDLVRQCVEDSGGSFHFHKLRMRPGKPIAFGQLGSTFLFCLPGNPVSSLVTFEVFVRPALCQLMGEYWEPPTVMAYLGERLEKKEGLTVFYRVKLHTSDEGIPTVILTGDQGSHQLRSMVEAHGLLCLPEDVSVLEEGTEVAVRLLS